MNRLVALTYLFSTLATALAWAVVRSRPAHWPLAALLTFGLASDIMRRALKAYVLVPGYAILGQSPATGWLRVAGIADQAVFLAWPAALAAVTLWIYLRRGPGLVALGYLAGVLGIAVFGYPAIRGELLRKAYLGIELACLAITTGAFLHWIAFRKDPPTTTHWMILLMVGTEVTGIIAGPWRLGLFTTWSLAQTGYCIQYALLIAIQGALLWMKPPSIMKS